MKTIVRSLRIGEGVWAKLGELARAKGKTRNALIMEIILEYCEKVCS